MTDLNKYTKSELIWLVNRVAQHTSPLNSAYVIDRCTSDLNYEREKKRIDKAGQYGKIAAAKRRECIELVKPYEGKPAMDVPINVIERAEELLREARHADKKFAELMAIEV